MKSFGWIIRRVFTTEPKHQYLAQIRIPDYDPVEFSFMNSRHNATLLSEEDKDAVLTKLAARQPQTNYDAVELFWEGE